MTLFKKLKSIHILLLTLVTTSFIIIVLYIAKHPLSVENVGLERWFIIITLGCIFGALKLFHPNTSDTKKSYKDIMHLYTLRYLMRSAILTIVYYSNLTCFFLTGTKNFIYLAFIVIFALFLCAPNKNQINDLINKNKENNK